MQSNSYIIRNLLELNFKFVNNGNHIWCIFCENMFGPVFLNKKIIDKNILKFQLKATTRMRLFLINIVHTKAIQELVISNTNQSLLSETELEDIFNTEYKPDEHISLLNKHDRSHF